MADRPQQQKTGLLVSCLECTVSWIFKNAKGRDAKLISTHAAFKDHPEPTIKVTSPECGADGVTLSKRYMVGEGRFPGLEWETVEGVKQWVVYSEDPDAPLSVPICHGIYLGIPPEKTTLANDDLERADTTSSKLKSGLFFGQSRNGSVYIPPRPLMNHGIHRYIYEVIALKQPLEADFIASRPDRDAVAEKMQDKILAWGVWTAQCERKWGD